MKLPITIFGANILKIEKIGIRFQNRYDEIIWIYPWKRLASNRKYISILSEGVFSSLKELNKFWEEYHDQEGNKRKD